MSSPLPHEPHSSHWPPAEPADPCRTASRRDLLRWTALTALTAGAAGVLPSSARAATRTSAVPAASTFSPLRPPATPLAVRSPYLSVWQASDTLTGTWASFWNGRTTAFCGIARIDGASYTFAGAPSSAVVPNTMTQVSLQVTATRSIYTLSGGGVTLTVTFFSPVDLGNLQRQCLPFSYVTMQAASADGGSHTVDLHLDISAEWAHGDDSQLVTWSKTTTPAGSLALSFTPNSPTVLSEYGDQASWGTVVFATPSASGLSWQIGQDTVVRGATVGQGALANTADSGPPRAIDNAWPVLGLNRNLGTVTAGAASAQFQIAVGHVRSPAVSYLGTNLPAWWTNYWSSWPGMLDWFFSDYPGALSAATALDQQIQNAATAAGGAAGPNYAALCVLALRQAVAGTELVNRNGAPWVFLKEISSDGNVSTVDVTYPAFPAYLYLSPAYLQLLLEPLLQYPADTNRPASEPFAQHDMGWHYPNASGPPSADTEAMPVEETGNMLIMVAALVQRLPSAGGTAFAQAHYPLLRQWAEYLVANTLDPVYQNTTDDFNGEIAHSTNLALKGMVGIGAMSVIAAAAGNTADSGHYRSLAFGYISQWVSKSQDSSGTHQKLAYDQDGTWSLKYNGFPDRLLGLNLIPTGVAAQEAAWYQAKAIAPYGVQLDPRNIYTKADWEIWTAAWLSAQTGARDMLINGVYNFANATATRVPFTDFYDVPTAARQGFADRPVVGGVFALLLPPAADTVTWHRIQNQNSGKLLAVSGMSLADSANVTQWSDNGTVDHLWAIVDNGDGTVRIANRNSGKVLAVNNQSTADGAFVQQYQDNGTPDHLWRLVDAGGGWTKIANLHSGKVLAVSGMSLQDGAQVTQWSDNGTTDHLWRFV
ncbi:hypothetical protein ABIA33_003011 [Streptacidiphilus sp. MAP12-16]|uniref:glutaminase domain-containing protein n=1 Tax=Streptacidiphilus sp. MAP12-16 TaxID=3156300 RepID=UPI003517E385